MKSATHPLYATQKCNKNHNFDLHYGTVFPLFNRTFEGEMRTTASYLRNQKLF